MSKRIGQAVIVFLVLIAAAQLVRPQGNNPPIDASRTIQAHVGNANLVAILDRSCGDCHSNRTAWPWYTQVAPVSWVMAYGVGAGRKAVNFSEWGGYPPQKQRALLLLSCREASAGKMPDRSWIAIHPEAKLSTQDIETICSAAGQVAGATP